MILLLLGALALTDCMRWFRPPDPEPPDPDPELLMLSSSLALDSTFSSKCKEETQ